MRHFVGGHSVSLQIIVLLHSMQLSLCLGLQMYIPSQDFLER